MNLMEIVTFNIYTPILAFIFYQFFNQAYLPVFGPLN